MKPNGKALKIIGLLMSGVVMVGGAVASGYKIKEEARNYTDTKTEMLREEQADTTSRLREDVFEMKEDIAVIRTIVEERFGKRRAEASAYR